MPTFGTKTRSKSSRRAEMPSREEIHREAERAQADMRAERVSGTKKPDAFKRFMNWVGSLLSKNNEPNLEEGATGQGNISAVDLEAEIHDTLSSDITDEGVNEPIEQGSVIQNGKVEAGNITFNLDEEEAGYLFSNSGTIKIFGKETAWSADQRISLTTEDNVNYFCSGGITFEDSNLSYEGNAVVIMMNNKARFIFDGGLLYTRDGIKMQLGNEQDSLNEFKLDKVSLLNYKPEGEGELTGKVTLGADGFSGFADKAPKWKPAFLSGGGFVKLTLGMGKDGKLGFSVMPSDRAITLGAEKVAELKSEPINVTVLEDGTLTYHVPEKYTFDVLGGRYSKEITLTGVDLVSGGQGLKEIALPEFDLESEGAVLSDASIKLSLEDGGRSGSFSASHLTYKGLNINALSGSVGEGGITGSAEGFDFTVGSTKLTGSLEGFAWQPDKFFSVTNFTISADKIVVNDNISFDAANLGMSFVNGVFAFNAGVSLSIGELRLGMLSIGTDQLAVTLTLNDDGSAFSFGTTMSGAVTFSIGAAGAALASAVVNDFSYTDGVIDVKKFTFDTTFDKLLSDKLSGSASVASNGFKFSCREPHNAEIGSLTLNIKNLDYNNKTLAKNTSVALVFKDGEQPASVPTEGELAVGNNSGTLIGAQMTVYMTETMRGVNITASSFALSPGGYVDASFSGLSASFMSGAGDNGISAESVEIKSGEKLKALLGGKEITFDASGVSISASGISFGSLSTTLSAIEISNAISFGDLKVEASFNDDQTFKSLEMSGSAQLGDIALNNVVISGGEGNVEFSADSITYANKNLEIIGVSGTFGNDGVAVESAAFKLTISDEDVSGTLRNLRWSAAENFSVEKFEISVNDIQVGDGLSVSGGQVSLSLENKVFKLGAAGDLHIDERKYGIVKINSADLAIDMGVGSNADESGVLGFYFNGSVTGELKIDIGDNVSLSVNNISYSDGVFSVGRIETGVELNKLLGNLGGKGTLSLAGLNFKKGEEPSVGAITLTASDVTLNGKNLIGSLTVGIILDAEDTPSAEQTSSVSEAALPLDGSDDGKLEGVDISLYLTEAYKGVKIAANKYSVTKGSFAFGFEAFKGEFSAGKCVIGAGKAAVECAFSDELKKIAGISKMSVSAEGLSYDNGKLGVKTISASAAGEIDIFGLKVLNAKGEFAFDENMNITSINLGGTLSIGKYFSGGAEVNIDTNGGISIGEVKDLKLSYGCFQGSVESIAKEGDTVKLSTLTLSKVENELNDGGFEGKPNSIVAKFLDTIPNIGITIKEMTFSKGVPIKPKFEDITIDSFEKEFKLGDSTSINIGYKGGLDGDFSVGLHSGLNIPADGSEDKEIKLVHAPVPIIPGVLDLEFNLGFHVNLSTAFDVGVTAKRNDEAVSFAAKISSTAEGSLGFYGEALIAVKAIIAGLKGGVQLSLDMPTKASLTGGLGVLYDPSVKEFFKAFSIDKESTNLNFSATEDLVFNVNLVGGLTGLPAVLSGNTLYHSWNLFSYKLGGASITGGIAYDPAGGKYRFSADPKFSGPDDLNYSPIKTDEQLKEFKDSYEDLKRSMEEISALMARVKNGADLNDGSLDEVSGDLGKLVDSRKGPLMTEVKTRIDDAMKSSGENSVKCHDLMTSLGKTLDKSAEKLVENERNVEHIERVIKDSQTALEIIGFAKDDGTMTAEKYRELKTKFEKMKTDDAVITQLAMLDPAAVVNMFKTFKLSGTVNWDRIHDNASKMMLSQAPEPAQGGETHPQIDSGIYKGAMGGVSKIMKDTDSSIKKQEALVQEASDDLEKAKQAQASGKVSIDKEIADLRVKLEKESGAKSSGFMHNVRIKNLNSQIDGKERAKRRLDAAVTAAESQYNDALSKLEALKAKLDSSADLSTVMLGFDSFITSEYNRTTDKITDLRKRYGVGSERVVPVGEELEQRKNNVILIIDQLINSANGENLDKYFAAGKGKNVQRYSERLKNVREGEGLVDVSMRGYGVTGRSYEKSYKDMKAENENFKTILTQLDAAYDQLTKYHQSTGEALKSWEEVNKIVFLNLLKTSEFAQSSEKAVDLIRMVEKVEENKIDETAMNKLTEDAKRLAVDA